MNEQRINYLGPKLKVSIGDGIVLTDNVRSFHVWSSRVDPADVCEIEIADPRRLLVGKIAEDDSLVIEWGYKGFEFEKIFNGLVAEVKEGPRLFLRGVDPMKKLYDARITKTFQDERPATIIRNLLEPLGIDASEIVEVDTILDKLPLYEDHIVHAIRTINRRLVLDHHFWFDIDGVFHWEPLEIPEEVSWIFRERENVIELELKPGVVTRLLTIGITARHGEKIELADAHGDVTPFWIEKAHCFQAEKSGFRTELFLREVA
jgi:hypothetical protein